MAPGAAVEFKRKLDRNGKAAAWDVTVAGASASTMPCFSMSQPFASLLLNGIKTVETRNTDIFGPFAGLRTLIIRFHGVWACAPCMHTARGISVRLLTHAILDACRSARPSACRQVQQSSSRNDTLPYRTQPCAKTCNQIRSDVQ